MHGRVLGFLTLFLACAFQSQAFSGPPQQGPVTPDEAAKMVGKEVTVEFKVQATGGSGNRIFLNSEADFRSSKNFTVVLEKSAQEELAKAQKIDKPRDYYKGKTIRVTGKVELFKDKPEIRITKAGQIKTAK
jgi:DNA/RNA endonuclease YhcR with UshA esterase domain